MPQVGGDKYFNVYCPEYGVDCRLYVEHVGLPCRANWNAAARTLGLEPEAKSQQQPKGESGAKGGKQMNKRYPPGSASSSGDKAVKDDKRRDPCSAEFCYPEWIAHLGRGSSEGGGGLLNKLALQPVALPLQVGSRS